MSKAAKFNQFMQVAELFLAQNPREFLEQPASYNDFEGPDVSDVRETLRWVLMVIEALPSSGVSSALSWHAFNGLVGLMQNVVNSYTQLRTARDQSSFQAFATNLDALAYHLRWFGVASVVAGEVQFESKVAQATAEIERMTAASREVSTLRDQVKELIAPAVAGSLSTAFSERKDALFKGRIVWLVLSVVAAIGAIVFTASFSSAISTALESDAARSPPSIWALIAVRSLLLLPTYAAFWFAVSQYRKERDFEEQYAHKAALAISLPNYGDLARGDAVRDQIVTGATSVVFSPPTSQPGLPKASKKELDDLKGVLDSVASIVSKRQ
jgi:hypothetical protein